MEQERTLDATAQGHRGMVEHPGLLIIERFQEFLAKTLRQLGLTPTSRKNVERRIDHANNPFAVFFQDAEQ